MLTLRAAGMVCVGLMVLGTGVVFGQDYPSKPIRMVAPGAGGGVDFTARLIMPGISNSLGQPVMIDNRASGIVQGEIVSKAPPDGYTLLVAGSTFLVGPLLQKTPYDPVRDFAPISLICRAPNILVVHPSVPVKSVKELIALAKARPGELNYSAGGKGGAAHLSGELFKAMAGISMVAIPYKSGSQETADLIGGHVQLTFATSGQVSPLVKMGKLRALAVTSAQPSALVPGLPTVAASGVPGYEATQPTVLFAPAKTPEAIIKRLNREIAQFLSQSDVKQKFLISGLETVDSSPEELDATVKSHVAKWGKVIKDAGITTD